MSKRRRSYAMIEPYVWNDPTFRSLPEGARFLWIHLLTSPRATKLPGLLKASPIIVMSDIGWDRASEGELSWSEEEVLTRGIQKTTRSLAVLENTVHSSGSPWIIVDRKNNLILLPRRIERMVPDNVNMVTSWISALAEVPPSTGRDNWVIYAYKTLKNELGGEDKRTLALLEHYRAANKRQQPGSEVNPMIPMTYRNLDETHTLTHAQTHIETVPIPSPPILDIRSEILDSKKAEKSEERRGLEPQQGESTPCLPLLALSEKETVKVTGKETDLPAGASRRLKQIYDAMQREKFNVPGHGDLTMWEKIDRPRVLAEKLETGAPGVDVPALIQKLAGWTYANPTRAKVNLARFIWSAATRAQDQPAKPGTCHDNYAYGTDMEEKISRAKKGRSA